MNKKEKNSNFLKPTIKIILPQILNYCKVPNKKIIYKEIIDRYFPRYFLERPLAKKLSNKKILEQFAKNHNDILNGKIKRTLYNCKITNEIDNFISELGLFSVHLIENKWYWLTELCEEFKSLSISDIKKRGGFKISWEHALELHMKEILREFNNNWKNSKNSETEYKKGKMPKHHCI